LPRLVSRLQEVGAPWSEQVSEVNGGVGPPCCYCIILSPSILPSTLFTSLTFNFTYYIALQPKKIFEAFRKGLPTNALPMNSFD